MAARSNHISLVDMIIKADRFYQREKVPGPCLKGVTGAPGGLGFDPFRGPSVSQAAVIPASPPTGEVCESSHTSVKRPQDAAMAPGWGVNRGVRAGVSKEMAGRF